jgi:hypothetical protein
MTLATSTRGLGGCGKRECTVIYRYGAVDRDLFSNVPQEGCPTKLKRHPCMYVVFIAK